MNWKKRLGLTILFSWMVLGLAGCGSSSDGLKVSAVDHFNRGNDYYEQNRLQAAAEEYRYAISEDPEQERFHYNLGLVYYRLVLYEKAIQSYQQAIKLNPHFTAAWYNLSLALEKTDQTEKAYMAYQKYLTLNKETQQQEDKKSNPKPVVIQKPGRQDKLQ